MPIQNLNQNRIPPEEQYRQPGAFEHDKKNWFALHHLVGYTLLAAVFFAIVAVAYYYVTVQKIPNQPPQAVIHQDTVKLNSPADSNLRELPGSLNGTDSYYRIDYLFLTKSDGSVIPKELILLDKNGSYKIIPDNIAEMIDSPVYFAIHNQNNNVDLDRFAPIDPNSKDLVYFTVNNTNYDSGVFVSKIYSYNLGTQKLTLIFQTNQAFATILRGTGTFEGEKLILYTDTADDSPGPCTNIWFDFKGQTVYLDISNLSKGLQKYIVPVEKQNEGKLDDQNCYKNL